MVFRFSDVNDIGIVSMQTFSSFSSFLLFSCFFFLRRSSMQMAEYWTEYYGQWHSVTEIVSVRVCVLCRILFSICCIAENFQKTSKHSQTEMYENKSKSYAWNTLHWKIKFCASGALYEYSCISVCMILKPQFLGFISVWIF